METKWMAITLCIVFAATLAPVTVSEYQKSQCRIEAIKAGVEADKINQACGVK